MSAKSDSFPLRTRKLLNHQEFEIYQLVKQVYEGQDVLVKVSLSRMVLSPDQEQRQALFRFIEKLFFLFVVIDAETNVVACIDFYSPTWKKRKDVRLKAYMMASLGIDYLVLGSEYLSDLQKIHENLGLSQGSFDHDQHCASQTPEQDFTQVKRRLQALLKSRRKAAKRFRDSSTTNDSDLSVPYDSFLQPLDER
jgi:hypothetical protein